MGSNPPPPLNLGNLDFSALLNQQSPPAAASTVPTMPSVQPPPSAAAATPPFVSWPNMNIQEARSSNKSLEAFVSLLLSPSHPNLLKELSHVNPPLQRAILSALSSSSSSPQDSPDNVTAVLKVYQQHTVLNAISGAHSIVSEQNEEQTMRNRLLSDPMDPVANNYFGEKIRLENVHTQYEQMMNEYPESMGNVLMLYVSAEVNKVKFPCFVDSGAQTTIMSSAFAEKCSLLHLVDKRFHGVAVGVGTGKILGRIHCADIVIAGCHFPCTFTVMDSNGKGLGDKNMDMLFGLDMLKRHRCR